MLPRWPIHKKSVLLGVVLLIWHVHRVCADSFLNYNVVVTNTLTDSSHIQGRTFVDNLAVSNQPDFAQSSAAGTGDTLDAAGTVSGSGLTLERGVFRHAGGLPAGFTLNLNGGSTQMMDPSTTVTALANQMAAAAGFYDTLSGAAVSYNSVTNSADFIGSGPGFDVFTVSAADLAHTNESVNVTVGTASAILIKVTGSSLTFGSSEHVNLTGSGQNVLWYFPSATTIALNDSQWNGSILATAANLTSPNQQIAGGVYVQNFTQTADVHLSDSTLGPGQPMYTGPVAAPLPISMLAGAALMGTLAALRISRRRGTQVAACPARSDACGAARTRRQRSPLSWAKAG